MLTSLLDRDFDGWLRLAQQAAASTEDRRRKASAGA
jgi:hypothetical protein